MDRVWSLRNEERASQTRDYGYGSGSAQTNVEWDPVDIR